MIEFKFLPAPAIHVSDSIRRRSRPFFCLPPPRDDTESKPESGSRRTHCPRHGLPSGCPRHRQFHHNFWSGHGRFFAARSKPSVETSVPLDKSSGGRILGRTPGENIFQRGSGCAVPPADYGRDAYAAGVRRSSLINLERTPRRCVPTLENSVPPGLFPNNGRQIGRRWWKSAV